MSKLTLPSEEYPQFPTPSEVEPPTFGPPKPKTTLKTQLIEDPDLLRQRAVLDEKIEQHKNNPAKLKKYMKLREQLEKRYFEPIPKTVLKVPELTIPIKDNLYVFDEIEEPERKVVVGLLKQVQYKEPERLEQLIFDRYTTTKDYLLAVTKLLEFANLDSPLGSMAEFFRQHFHFDKYTTEELSRMRLEDFLPEVYLNEKVTKELTDSIDRYLEKEIETTKRMIIQTLSRERIPTNPEFIDPNELKNVKKLGGIENVCENNLTSPLSRTFIYRDNDKWWCLDAKDVIESVLDGLPVTNPYTGNLIKEDVVQNIINMYAGDDFKYNLIVEKAPKDNKNFFLDLPKQLRIIPGGEGNDKSEKYIENIKKQRLYKENILKYYRSLEDSEIEDFTVEKLKDDILKILKSTGMSLQDYGIGKMRVKEDYINAIKAIIFNDEETDDVEELNTTLQNLAISKRLVHRTDPIRAFIEKAKTSNLTDADYDELNISIENPKIKAFIEKAKTSTLTDDDYDELYEALNKNKPTLLGSLKLTEAGAYDPEIGVELGIKKGKDRSKEEYRRNSALRYYGNLTDEERNDLQQFQLFAAIISILNSHPEYRKIVGLQNVMDLSEVKNKKLTNRQLTTILRNNLTDRFKDMSKEDLLANLNKILNKVRSENPVLLMINTELEIEEPTRLDFEDVEEAVFVDESGDAPVLDFEDDEVQVEENEDDEDQETRYFQDAEFPSINNETVKRVLKNYMLKLDAIYDTLVQKLGLVKNEEKKSKLEELIKETREEKKKLIESATENSGKGLLESHLEAVNKKIEKASKSGIELVYPGNSSALPELKREKMEIENVLSTLN